MHERSIELLIISFQYYVIVAFVEREGGGGLSSLCTLMSMLIAAELY